MATHLPYVRMYSNREIVIEDAGKLTSYSEDSPPKIIATVFFIRNTPFLRLIVDLCQE